VTRSIKAKTESVTYIELYYLYVNKSFEKNFKTKDSK